MNGSETTGPTISGTGANQSVPLNYGRKRAAKQMLSTSTKRPTIPDAPSRTTTRIIYALGKVAREERENIQQQIDDLHGHPAIQSKCKELEESGAQYLKFTSSHGTGLKAKCPIPPDTALCYYIGHLYDAQYNPLGNHSMSLGFSNQTSIIINATRGTWQLFSELEFFPIFPDLFSKGIGYRVGLGYRV
jgi:hypothetical protein